MRAEPRPGIAAQAAPRAFSSRLSIVQCEAASARRLIPTALGSVRLLVGVVLAVGPLGDFRNLRADGHQVFGGYAVRVQVDCTQRLDRGPHGGRGDLTSLGSSGGRDMSRAC